MAKIKLTALETITAWNLLSNYMDISDNPNLTGWVKRLFAYMRPEVKIWGTLTIEEREAVKDSVLSYPVDKLKAQHLPDLVEEDHKPVLEKLCEGEIKVYEAQLSKQLKPKKKSGT